MPGRIPGPPKATYDNLAEDLLLRSVIVSSRMDTRTLTRRGLVRPELMSVGPPDPSCKVESFSLVLSYYSSNGKKASDFGRLLLS